MNILEEAKIIAETADVSTPKDCVVLYSISYLPTRENKDNALRYMRKHSEAMMLDNTECGKRLIALNLETGSGVPNSEILKIWAIASKRFIASVSGNVTAFVDNADKRSTFVSIELPHILQNEAITSINNTDKIMFAHQFLSSEEIENILPK